MRTPARSSRSRSPRDCTGRATAASATRCSRCRSTPANTRRVVRRRGADDAVRRRRTARRLGLGARRGRARAAGQDPLPPRLRRPLRRLREEPERRAALRTRRSTATRAGPRSRRSASSVELGEVRFRDRHDQKNDPEQDQPRTSRSRRTRVTATADRPAARSARAGAAASRRRQPPTNQHDGVTAFVAGDERGECRHREHVDGDCDLPHAWIIPGRACASPRAARGSGGRA